MPKEFHVKIAVEDNGGLKDQKRFSFETKGEINAFIAGMNGANNWPHYNFVLSKSWMKHTPGPWEVRPGSWAGEQAFQPFAISAVGANGQLVAVIEGEEENYPTSTDMANAHIIAAAPEMLSVLISLSDAHCFRASTGDSKLMETLKEIAVATIRKATGDDYGA